MEKIIWFTPWLATILITVFALNLVFGRIPIQLGIYVIMLSAIFISVYLLSRMLTLSSLRKIKLLVSLIISMLLLFVLFLNLSGFQEILDKQIIYIYAYPTEFNLSIFKEGHFFGTHSVIEFFVLLLKQKATLIINILSSLYFIALFPLLFILLKKILNMYSYIRLLILSSLFLSFFYSIFRYFSLSLDQLIFIGLTLFILNIFIDNMPNILKARPAVSDITLYDILFAISLFSLSTIYPPGFRIVIILFFVAILSIFFAKQNMNIIYFFSKIFVLTIIINPLIFSTALNIK